jgi:hypothetical protein
MEPTRPAICAIMSPRRVTAISTLQMSRGTIQGGPSRTSTVGDVIHEEPMQVSETRNSGPVNPLIFRVVEKNEPVTVRFPWRCGVVVERFRPRLC